jgi:hypothetical protein
MDFVRDQLASAARSGSDAARHLLALRVNQEISRYINRKPIADGIRWYRCCSGSPVFAFMAGIAIVPFNRMRDK